MSAAGLSDLVRDSELRTRISNNLTHHTYYVTRPGIRRQRMEETWRQCHRLGNGAFGCVWLEQCDTETRQGQLRAVKEIKKDATEQYDREIEAMAKFSHDNYVHCFVQFFGWYENENSLFLAMEYLEHGDLQKYLDGPFAEIEAKQISAQLAEGLVFLHENNFTHRDLKPPNIPVVQPRPKWWVKIGDFGISKRCQGTVLRTQAGTPGYVAPEVISIHSRLDHGGSFESYPGTYNSTVDIWSLGAIIVRMLAQKPLFLDSTELFKYARKEIPFPRRVLDGKQVSDECYDFLERAMAPSPSGRLKANEACAHPWLNSSRPLSRAISHHEMSGAIDALTSVRPVPIPETNGTNIMDTAEGSLAWPTLSIPKTTTPRNTTKPKLTKPDNETTSEVLVIPSEAGAVNPNTLPMQLSPRNSSSRREVNSAFFTENTQRSTKEHNLTQNMTQTLQISDDQAREVSFRTRIKNYIKPISLLTKTSFNLKAVPDYEAPVKIDGVDTLPPNVRARLSFAGIEELASDILAVARQIYIDTEVVAKSRAARNLNDKGKAKMVQDIIQNIDINTTSESIKSAIADGAVTNGQALKAALKSKNNECLIALLQCGADPNATDSSKTVLSGRTQRLDDPSKLTALTLAASSQNEFGVWALVSAGARVNVYYNDDSYSTKEIRPTPLMEALIGRHTNIVRFLLANGANPDCIGDAGISPAERPIRVALMRPPQAEESSNAAQAYEETQNKSLKLASLLLQYKADINQDTLFLYRMTPGASVDEYYNPFHFAAWWGYAETLVWLAKNVTNIKWEWHRLAIYCAVVRENWECFEVLKKPPYKATENLHILIHEYMDRYAKGAELSRESFSRAIRELLSTGLDLNKKIKFEYDKEGPEGGRTHSTGRVSALKLIETISSTEDRRADMKNIIFKNL